MRKLKPHGVRTLPYIAAFCTAILMFTGCAALWQPVPGQLVVGTCSVTPPPGWMRLSTASYEMLSKDGPYLQYIFVQQRPLRKAFHYTRQALDQTLLPSEAAEIAIDNLRSDPQIAGFRLISSQPAALDGHPGFKLMFSHKDRQGVTIRSLYYGLVLDNSFLNLRYTAAERHYFEKDITTFEQMIKTLHLSS